MLSMHIVNEHINISLTSKRNYVIDVIFKMHCIHNIFVKSSSKFQEMLIKAISFTLFKSLFDFYTLRVPFV